MSNNEKKKENKMTDRVFLSIAYAISCYMVILEILFLSENIFELVKGFENIFMIITFIMISIISLLLFPITGKGENVDYIEIDKKKLEESFSETYKEIEV